MRIDYPIQTTPEMIHSLHSAVQQSNVTQFAMMMSLMSVQSAPVMTPALVDEPALESSEKEDDTVNGTVNGSDFLNTILLSQQMLLAK